MTTLTAQEFDIPQKTTSSTTIRTLTSERVSIPNGKLYIHCVKKEKTNARELSHYNFLYRFSDHPYRYVLRQYLVKII